MYVSADLENNAAFTYERGRKEKKLWDGIIPMKSFPQQRLPCNFYLQIFLGSHSDKACFQAPE